jgi:hypothetical protein
VPAAGGQGLDAHIREIGRGMNFELTNDQAAAGLA